MIELGSARFDPIQKVLYDLQGQPIELRSQSLRVLSALADHLNSTVSQSQLFAQVWSGRVVTPDSLVQCIKEIRRALGDDAHRLLRTNPKRGYRLCAPIPPAPAHQYFEDGAGFMQTLLRTRSRDGTPVLYARSGSGPPLIRVTNWLTSVEYDYRTPVLAGVVHALASEFETYRYNPRGYGPGSSFTGKIDLDALVDDLAAVADASGHTRFALFANSGGVLPAVAYAARFPERLTHLILVGGRPHGALCGEVSPKDREQVLAINTLIEAGWGQSNPAFRQMMGLRMYPSVSADELHYFSELQRNTASGAQVFALRMALAQMDVRELLPQIKTPTLVVHSERDPAVPVELGRFIASQVRNARFVCLDSDNHTPLPGEPAWDTYLHEVRRFLNMRPANASDNRSIPQEALTQRERKLLELITQEVSYQDIAERLGIAKGSVHGLARHLFLKLGVTSRRDAARALRDRSDFGDN